MNPVNNSEDTLILAPTAITHGATQTANWDISATPGGYATIRIAITSEGATTATGPTISLLESDDTVVTNFATVVANRTAEDITAAKAVTYHVDLRGRKRYLRLSVTPPSGSTNNNVTVSAIGTVSARGVGPDPSDTTTVTVV